MPRLELEQSGKAAGLPWRGKDPAQRLSKAVPILAESGIPNTFP